MWHKPRLDPNIESLFETINYVFLVIFLIEAALKLVSMGTMYYKDPYNVFDFSILSITVFSMFLAYTKIVDLGN